MLVSAAREQDGLRVRFHRTRPGTAGYLAQPEADGGRIEEVVHSPDHRTVSFLWRAPAGEARFRFPYGGSASFAADAAVDPGSLDYVFFEGAGVRVTARVPRGCPMRPFVDLRVVLPPGTAPARVSFPDGRWAALEEEDNSLRWDLPKTPEGVLAGGDHGFVLRAGGTDHAFWISVDPDGALAAPGGYLENW